MDFCDTLLIKDKGLIWFSLNEYCICRKELLSSRRIMHDATNNESNVLMIFFLSRFISFHHVKAVKGRGNDLRSTSISLLR